MLRKIRIEHSSNPLNYGTNMMVTNFMYYLDKYSKLKNEYILDVYRDEDLKNYSHQYKEGCMKRETIDYTVAYSNSFLEKVINKVKREISFEYFYNKQVEKMKKNTDRLVILGGDDLSECYGLEPLKRELNRIDNIKKDIKVFLIGQTIGPFNDERIALAEKCLKDVLIYSRDPWTTKYLVNTLKVNSVKESSDLAILPLPYQGNKDIEDKILKKYKLEKDKYITLVPSGLYKSYCSNFDVYIENWVRIVKKIRDKYKDIKLVFLPHVLRYEQFDDRNIISELENKLNETDNNIYIYDEMMPLQARFILGNGICTITGRMHGAVSTIQMGKPAISISYSEKYNGVIGEGLKLKDTIVDGRLERNWNDFLVADEVINKFNYVLDNMNGLKLRINKSVLEAQSNVEDMIKSITREL